MATMTSVNGHEEILSVIPTDNVLESTRRGQHSQSSEVQTPDVYPTKVEVEAGEPALALSYSVFTTTQKRWIVFIAALAGWFSTASSFIYFPAIPFLAHDLDISIQKVNLTVVSYLVASGIFPAVLGNAADNYGRRPVFIVAIGVYVAINIGLAVQRSFAALITLRMMQSVAISGTFSFAYGVLGDLTTPADRGGYIGFISIFLNTPPSVAPLISGLLLIRWNWSAIFWFLSIVSSVVFVAILLFLPETCRRLVGNGSIRPPLANKALVPLLCPTGELDETPRSTDVKLDRLKSTVNPFAAFTLLRNYGSGVAVLCYGIYYTIYSCLQASLSTIFVDVYGVSGLIAGLSYLSYGVACITASSLAGKLLDYDYSRTARSLGISVDRHREDDLATFPIEYARLRTCKYFIALCAPFIVGYGWALQLKLHIVVPLILQFFIGFTNQVNFTSLNALLVDFHPDQPSAIQAACNFVRCELAAGGIALLDPLLRALGPGRCFVLFATLHILTLPALWALERYGLSWRKKNT